MFVYVFINGGFKCFWLKFRFVNFAAHWSWIHTVPEASPVINVSFVNQYIQLFLDTVCSCQPVLNDVYSVGTVRWWQGDAVSHCCSERGTGQVETGFVCFFNLSLCCGPSSYQTRLHLILGSNPHHDYLNMKDLIMKELTLPAPFLTTREHQTFSSTYL